MFLNKGVQKHYRQGCLLDGGIFHVGSDAGLRLKMVAVTVRNNVQSQQGGHIFAGHFVADGVAENQLVGCGFVVGRVNFGAVNVPRKAVEGIAENETVCFGIIEIAVGGNIGNAEVFIEQAFALSSGQVEVVEAFFRANGAEGTNVVNVAEIVIDEKDEEK